MNQSIINAAMRLPNLAIEPGPVAGNPRRWPG